MAKKNNISTINLSLLLIILICGIIFFVYLRKERFQNIQDMLSMQPNDVRAKLQKVKNCIQNPDSCDQEKRDEIVNQLDTLISLSHMI